VQQSSLERVEMTLTSRRTRSDGAVAFEAVLKAVLRD
jgi:hypothetical protein